MTFDIWEFVTDWKENEARKLYRKKIKGNCLMQLIWLFISISIASTVISWIYKKDIEPILKEITWDKKNKKLRLNSVFYVISSRSDYFFFILNLLFGTAAASPSFFSS